MAKQKNFHTFEQWTSFDVMKKIGVRETLKSNGLQSWITIGNNIPPEVEKLIESYGLRLRNYYQFWNEQELFGKFIAPFLLTVGMEGEDYNLFHERPLKATINDYTVSGIVDGIVAFGNTEPLRPYFFLHEYKRMKQSEADPLGQLLIAMLAARELNQDGKPLYGCFIIGKMWQFVLLDGDTYAQTQGYDATDPGELRTIWLILDKTKQIIIERIAEDFPNLK
jgi:hypothetical protein